ncbi:protein of unknown function [Micropruina glycogenica]|uniref:Uncharacterized protein n=1 Tax=Micropruina glycogenica TaxID=75385 RepID=A0A2N9JCD6_9ACTN|nr:protein of unknown function [Micropruina glycogenica]
MHECIAVNFVLDGRGEGCCRRRVVNIVYQNSYAIEVAALGLDHIAHETWSQDIAIRALVAVHHKVYGHEDSFSNDMASKGLLSD